MRKITIIFFIFYCISGYALHKTADSIIIRFASWETNGGPHTTSCVNFEYDVPYKEYSVKDAKVIKEVLDSLKEATRVETRDFSVGCKLLLVRGDSVVQKVALNSDYMLLNGKVYSCPLSVIKIINDLTTGACESKEQYHYLPDRLGNEYKKGRYALYQKLLKHLKKQKVFMHVKRDTRLVVYCHANQRGKTTRILQINVYNESLTNKEIKIIEKDLYKFFMKMRWKKNDTRMNCDFIKIVFKFTYDFTIKSQDTFKL